MATCHFPGCEREGWQHEYFVGGRAKLTLRNWCDAHATGALRTAVTDAAKAVRAERAAQELRDLGLKDGEIVISPGDAAILNQWGATIRHLAARKCAVNEAAAKECWRRMGEERFKREDEARREEAARQEQRRRTEAAKKAKERKQWTPRPTLAAAVTTTTTPLRQGQQPLVSPGDDFEPWGSSMVAVVDGVACVVQAWRQRVTDEPVTGSALAESVRKGLEATSALLADDDDDYAS